MRPHFGNLLHASAIGSLTLRVMSLALLGLALSACGEGEGGGSGGTGSGANGSAETFCNPAATCPHDASGEDLTTPVSFRADVFPIFQTTCNDSGCHGKETGTFGNLYLGPETGTPTEAEYTQIVTMLTGKTPEITSDVSLVAAGNWQQSLMMLKVDGCQNDAGLSCGEPPLGSLCDEACGDAMPPLAPDEATPFPISADQRRVLRAWIAQGALDN